MGSRFMPAAEVQWSRVQKYTYIILNTYVTQGPCQKAAGI